MLASLLALAIAPLCPTAAPLDVTVDAGRGAVVVRVPAAYGSAPKSPLILMLHGYTATPNAVDATFGIEPWLDAYGFLYAKPIGPVDAFGVHYWNASSACCDFLGVGTDDSDYLAALIQEIKAQLDVDERRVYVIGHSNGGFMAHRLVCDHGDELAAIVSISGAGLGAQAPCASTAPVSVLEIHGTQDTFIRYAGGVLGGSQYPSSRDTFERCALRNGCSAGPSAPGQSFDVDELIVGSEAVSERYTNCSGQAEVELWTLIGSGHTIDLSPSATPAILQWLLDHARPGIDQQNYCAPAPLNSSGLPGHIRAHGSDILARHDLTLVVEGLPIGAPGLCLVSLDAVNAPLNGVLGPRCVGAVAARLMYLGSATNVSGSLDFVADPGLFALPAGTTVASGWTWHFQGWYRDGATTAMSDALSVTLR
ncbi:MAG: alpha/beta fold hydrolase [Planctomycetota bacterium]